MNTDAGIRGTGNTLATPQDRGTTRDGNVIEEFVRLLKVGPADQRSAPPSITLPQALYAGMKRATDGSFADGMEHGGIFGYFEGTPPRFGILYGEGEKEGEFDFSKVPRWPALRPLGRFHTHLYQITDRGANRKPGWAGGGPSGTDLTNFYYRDERVSIVVAQTKWGKWKNYFLLKPQQYTIPGFPGTVGKEYEARVLAAVNGGLDPIDASERELILLAQQGAFVFYTSEDSPILVRKF